VYSVPTTRGPFRCSSPGLLHCASQIVPLRGSTVCLPVPISLQFSARKDGENIEIVTSRTTTPQVLLLLFLSLAAARSDHTGQTGRPPSSGGGLATRRPRPSTDTPAWRVGCMQRKRLRQTSVESVAALICSGDGRRLGSVGRPPRRRAVPSPNTGWSASKKDVTFLGSAPSVRAVFLEFLRREQGSACMEDARRHEKKGGGLGERAKRSGARKKTAGPGSFSFGSPPSAPACSGRPRPAGRVRFAFAFSRLYIRG